MRVFIVGATGVIGRTLVPRLIEAGDSVVALVRDRERARGIALPGVTLVEGDLLQMDVAQLTSLLEGCDVAAHMATALRAGSPGLGTTNTSAALRIDGTRRLLEAARAAGVSRYVQQSIALAYVDGGDKWLDESTAFFQTEPGVAPPHEQMEAMIRALGDTMEWMILRGGVFVGPDTFQNDTIEQLRAGTLRIVGDGRNWISQVHVDDYADAVARAIHSSETGHILNITAAPVRQGDYLTALAASLGVEAPAHDLERAAPRSYRCTSAAAERVLGWRPQRPTLPAL